MKKIMMLGGNYFQATAIKAAKELGHYVISVDYLPDNPGHKFSDEYHNVSTIDKEGVLKLAQELNIDGIMTFASDVSAPTASYVGEKMGLPTNPYESVMILTHKDRFRPFLQKHGFNCPRSGSFNSLEEALVFFNTFDRPVVVKPSDSSGSKGIVKVSTEEEFRIAFKNAMAFSKQKIVMVEEFIKRKDHQVTGDFFIVDGELRFCGFMDHHNDKLGNPLVPIGEGYPSEISDELKNKIKSELNRLIKLLDLKLGAINVDIIIDENDEIWFVEIGPRNGGNYTTDAIKEASGIDLAKCTVQAYLNLDFDKSFTETKHNLISSYIVHSLKNGIYRGTIISEKIKDDILQFYEIARKDDKVCAFTNGSLGTGIMLIRHDSIEQMNYRMDNMEEFIRVEVE